MRRILKCSSCGKYTMSESCECGGRAVNPRPPKYSPQDRYAEYRRKAKQKHWEQKGLL